MKKIKMLLLLLPLTFCIGIPKANSQIIIAEIIKAGIKKVIRAVDLQIQRQQNKVIWLQNAQKELENILSKLKLNEISDWTQKQKNLYQKYFDELQQVKSVISYYQRIKAISDKQVRLIAEYNRAWSLFNSDKHFSASELEYMGKVYSGILSETGKNVDEMIMVINSFKTQMSDAKRLEIISHAAERVEQNYSDLVKFNQQNAVLSLQRSTSDDEINQVKKMYGIQ